MKLAQTKRLYQDVDFLTGLRPYRNYQNLETLEQVCQYLCDQFEKAGYTPDNQTWLAQGNEYQNILASYRPKLSKRLIVGAHYDVCGDQPGADDNASAVAGLLETARLCQENQPDLGFGIDFVAYCLEEPPFFASEEMGSYVHAKSLHDAQVDVLGMVCYEMIGYFSDEPHSQPYPEPFMAKTYPHVANFIVVVGIEKHRAFCEKFYQGMKREAGIGVERFVFSDAGHLGGLSDQRNYWHFGYDALMVNDTSFIRNPHYHQVSDTIDTLDFPKMTEVVSASYRAITRLKVN